jgi:hypothetical protein
MTASATGWLCFSCGHAETGLVRPISNSVAPDQVVPANLDIPEASGAQIINPSPMPQTPDPQIQVSREPSSAVPVTNTNRPSPTTGKAVLISTTLVLLIIIGSIAGYILLIAPTVILPQYLARLINAKTTVFTSSNQVDSKTGYKFGITIAGKYDIKDMQKPKVEASITGKTALASGLALPGAASKEGSISAQLRVLPPSLFFKIDAFTILSQFFPIKISNDWYKYDIGDVQSATKCLSAKNDSGSLFGSQILTKLPVKYTSFRGIDTINGAPMLHYVGTIDNAKIKSAVDDANKSLSADCKLDISADDFKSLSVTYDIWRGWSSDRAAFSIVDSGSNTNSEITLDTGSYNQPVKIDVPADVKDASTLLNGLYGADSSSAQSASTRKNVPKVSSTPDQRARDAQRKTDVRAIQKGLEEYFVSNNYYPTDVSQLTSGQPDNAILKQLPKDPKAKSPYLYTYVPNSLVTGQTISYTLRACLENAADTGAGVIDPVTPCTTATYSLQNNN